MRGKNLRRLAGKPLIAHSLLQARASGLFEVIAVSSDSDAILEAAVAWGADLVIKRPEELATDQAAKLPVIRHAVIEVERIMGRTFDICVDLDATSPLRLPEDIAAAVRLIEVCDAKNVVTAMPARRSPYFNIVELDASGIVKLSKPQSIAVVRRQDAPACFDMNASIYVWRRGILLSDEPLFNDKTRLHLMPEERSIDIDSELDFRFVEFLMLEANGSDGFGC